MNLMERLLEAKRYRKKHRTEPYPENKLAVRTTVMFAPQQSSLLAVPSRKRSQHFSRPRDDIDDFLSSDLEASFASNVSINSPPRDYKTLSSDHGYAEPMDISPAPSRLPVAFESMKKPNRPRAFTSSARLFGSDISNNGKGLLPSPSLTSEPFMKPSNSITINKKSGLGRSAFPSELHFNVESIEFPRPSSLQEPTSPADDAMDVDTSYCADQPPVPQVTKQPHTAAASMGGFSSLFFDDSSPRRPVDTPSEPRVKKRRSFSPEPSRSFLLEEDSSFAPLESSPSQPRLQRKPSSPMLNSFNKLGKPVLAGLGAPSALQKRPRRPALSTMLGTGDRDANPTKSAFPVLLSAGLDDEIDSPKGSAPVRRAFSAAVIPPAPFADASFDAESSFEGPDMSSPAQAYSKRQQVKTLRRCDGTEDFRPMTGASALAARDSPSSRYLSQGLGMPGFGDNEAHGKILPCHRVREDGLMRITSQTLDDLLDGQYDSRIAEFRVIDCRFDYEYAGGHIPGAINVNTTTAVEELLLSGSGLTKPKPSTSGDSVKKTILVFHCEFSAKRGPTFAKHFRAKDRAMNNHIYPKIHFPELYILEGGYCEYYRNSGHRCEPQGYITMDDPTHAASRREDLDQFRKGRFGRVKSYGYGDGIGKLSASQPGGKRNITPPDASHGSKPTASFVAPSHLSRPTRRVGSTSLLPLPEHGNASLDGDDTDVDIGDSPCPPANKNAARKLNRGLMRAETYHAVRMVY